MKQIKWLQGHIIVCILFFAPIISTKLAAQNVPLTKEKIEAVLNEAYNKYKDIKEGKNAD